METLDPRMARFDHTVLAVGLLCGFVFALPAVVPVWGLLMLASAAFPTAAPVPRLYRAFVAPRRKPVDAPEPAAPWRTAALLAAALLGVGTLTLAIGEVMLTWLFALAAAGLGAVTGVGGVCPGCRLHSRGRDL